MSYRGGVAEYPSRFSGQGSLAKPNLHIFPMVAASTSAQTFVFFRSHKAPGSCILLTRAPGDVPCTIQIGFDEQQYQGINQIPKNLFTLVPGAVFDVRPGQFNTVTVVVIANATYGSPESFGTLIIGDGFDYQSNGASAGTPDFVLPGQRTQFFGTADQSAAATPWTNPNLGGIFNYQWINPQLPVGFDNYKVEYTNRGDSFLYVSSFLVTSNIPAFVAGCFAIAPGETMQFEGAPGVPGTGFPLYVYSPVPNALLGYRTLIYGE